MKTPELDKMAKIRGESQAAEAFLDWLSGEKELTLCVNHEHDVGCETKSGSRVCGFRNGDYAPTFLNAEKLLAEYFEINLEKCEKERRKILESLQKENAK